MVCGEAEGEVELTALPAAQTTVSTLTPRPAPLAPPSAESSVRAPTSPSMAIATQPLTSLAELANEWEAMAARYLWWTLTAARDSRTSREVRAPPRGTRGVEQLGHTAAAARATLSNLTQEPFPLSGLPGQLLVKRLREPAVPGDQVTFLFGFCSSRTESLASLLGPGGVPLRDFLTGVYCTGQALLGSEVAEAVASGLSLMATALAGTGVPCRGPCSLVPRCRMRSRMPCSPRFFLLYAQMSPVSLHPCHPYVRNRSGQTVCTMTEGKGSSADSSGEGSSGKSAKRLRTRGR
ncbi:hypothetical protein Emed_002322 [Eimeria media]